MQYSTAYICSSGFLTLGAAQSAATCAITAQRTNMAAAPPLLAPFWSSLLEDGNTIFCNGGDSDVTWDMGGASNRVDTLVRSSNQTGPAGFTTASYIAVTWRSLRYSSDAATTPCSNRVTFQVVLAVASNKDTFVVLQVCPGPWHSNDMLHDTHGAVSAGTATQCMQGVRPGWVDGPKQMHATAIIYECIGL